ncbi:hypothetical protein NST33_18305 [Paenibacillus sp. FSL L8-0435]|uniref:hypothetical protein n=1 Tax=Paenibacillus sp. FSL L8-0435 TaxID=2954618 RepID=UPI0030DD1F7D
MIKEQEAFLETINKGKWFTVKGKYGGVYAVKMAKSHSYDESIHSLWISTYDPESMSIEDYLKGDWKFVGNKFEQQGAGVYHFGSYEVEEDSIYDEEGKIVIEAMIDQILKNTEDGFVTSEEILDVWNKLSEDIVAFEILECK